MSFHFLVGMTYNSKNVFAVTAMCIFSCLVFISLDKDLEGDAITENISAHYPQIYDEVTF